MIEVFAIVVIVVSSLIGLAQLYYFIADRNRSNNLTILHLITALGEMRNGSFTSKKN